MNKSEARAVAKLVAFAKASAGASATSDECAILARSFSALIRASLTVRSRHAILVVASGWPCIVQHAEFIVA